MKDVLSGDEFPVYISIMALLIIDRNNQSIYLVEIWVEIGSKMLLERYDTNTVAFCVECMFIL